jgi:pyridoxamine 5'-phosphate oxidase
VDPGELDPDPISQFRRWLQDAESASPRPDAMTLATSTADGHPSARVVLLRGVDERGFVFFTNRESRKGGELAENPRVALVFHWYELGRQVRVEGSAEEVAPAESAAYWSTRPRTSQIAAWASPQSRRIESRAELEHLYANAEGDLGQDDVPLPPFWGGYRIVPETFEFWVHDEDRLHDRARYVRSDGAWLRERLAP